MSQRNQDSFLFKYEELIVARVTAVRPIPANDRRLLVDLLANDGRSVWRNVPISLPQGFLRNYRTGEQVVAGFRHLNSQYPVVLGHLLNNEAVGSGYEVPLPDAFQNLDDLIVHHYETGAFIRFRNVNSTPEKGAGPNQPVLIELVTTTGHHIAIDETNGSQAITITDAYGSIVKLDSTNKAISATTPGGRSVTIDDQNEKVEIVSSTRKIKLDDGSGLLYLGDDNLIDLNSVVLKEHLQAAKDDIYNTLVDWAHSLQSGSGASPPPAFSAATASSITRAS